MQLRLTHYTCMFALTMGLAIGPAAAQEQPQPASPAPIVEASTACFATFNIGSLIYCVSEHGNVVRLTAPAAGPEHIRIGVIREGYAVCAQPVLGGPTAVSYDAADTEAGFAVPVTISQPNGPNTLPLCITRTTLSGLQLTQCFSHNAATRTIVITMTVRNVSGVARFNVRLDRYFDGDIAGDAFDDRYTRSADSVWGEDGPHTVALSDINWPVIPHTTSVQTFVGFVAASCNQASLATPTGLGDFVGRLSYSFGNMLPGAVRTLRVQYSKL